MNIIQVFAIILAGISVGVADALIKKVSLTGNFWSSFLNPLMALILFLYLAQIALFIYTFRHNWNLGIVGNLQMVFYSLTVVIGGILFFGENISLIQSIGIGLALIGVILMNV